METDTLSYVSLHHSFIVVVVNHLYRRKIPLGFSKLQNNNLMKICKIVKICKKCAYVPFIMVSYRGNSLFVPFFTIFSSLFWE